MSKSNKNFRIATPHAAIKIWNYSLRGGAEGMSPVGVNDVNEMIISTVSCISIKTNKTKGNPIGAFTFTLAPTRNWISEIVAGSWCVIMMSDEPITQEVLNSASAEHVKMFGKIESVRASVSVDSSGARRTSYVVEGADWGYIFGNKIYMDPYIPSAFEPQTWGNTFAQFLTTLVDSKTGSAYRIEVNDLLRFFLNVFSAKGEATVQQKEGEIHRLGKSIYQFLIPDAVAKFFGFVYPSSQSATGTNVDANGQTQEVAQDIARLVNLRTGKLVGYDQYEPTNESFTYFNPFTMMGVHTFWQVMLDAINNALYEMFTDMEWVGGRPRLTLYNRICPFSYRDLSTDAQGDPVEDGTKFLRSKFNLVKTFPIDDTTVIAVNIGTNWTDKYNFIELRPDFPEFKDLEGVTYQKTQSWDEVAFNREGFRPRIIPIRQFPISGQGVPGYSPDNLRPWVQLNMEWHFDTHRLLSGVIKMTGTNEYISVGSNIRFDYGLVNTQNNFSSSTLKRKDPFYVLAQVESVQYIFEVEESGARSFFTVVQFVRGIVVNSNNQVIGIGSLDQNASSVPLSRYDNHQNVVTASESMDPDHIPDPIHRVIAPPGGFKS